MSTYDFLFIFKWKCWWWWKCKSRGGKMDIQIQMQTDGYRYRSGTFSDIVVSGYITFRYGCCALPCERSGQTERKIPRWRCIFVSDRYSNLFIVTFCGWLFVLFHVVAISVCSCFALLRISWLFDFRLYIYVHKISLFSLFFFCLSLRTQQIGQVWKLWNVQRGVCVMQPSKSAWK